jgi:hypothetical protein
MEGRARLKEEAANGVRKEDRATTSRTALPPSPEALILTPMSKTM